MNFNKQKVYSLIKLFYNKPITIDNSEKKEQTFILNNNNFEELFYTDSISKKLVLNNINDTSLYSFSFTIKYDENKDYSSFSIECIPSNDNYKTLSSTFEIEDISSFFTHMTMLIINIENDEVKQNTYQFLSQKNISI